MFDEDEILNEMEGNLVVETNEQKDLMKHKKKQKKNKDDSDEEEKKEGEEKEERKEEEEKKKAKKTLRLSKEKLDLLEKEDF